MGTRQVGNTPTKQQNVLYSRQRMRNERLVDEAKTLEFSSGIGLMEIQRFHGNEGLTGMDGLTH